MDYSECIKYMFTSNFHKNQVVIFIFQWSQKKEVKIRPLFLHLNQALYFRIPFNLLRCAHYNGKNYKQSDASGKQRVILQL